MIVELRQQIVELVTHGHEPGGIIMSPPQMRRFLKQAHVPGSGVEHDREAPSGYAFEGVPIFRSWEIIGPVAVSRDVLAVLRREVRTVFSKGSIDQPTTRAQHDLLF